MSQYGNSKNPPWSRSGGGGQQVGMMNSGGNMSQMSNNQLLQYPQAQMFQNQMGFQNQVYPNVGMGGAVSYPTRNQLNSAAFQNSSPQSVRNSGNQGDGQNKSQRVFTGTVTKLQDNFGFVDENVFFQTSCCVKGSNPQIGDRVLVEAIFNAAMPFKWNATRIQVLPNMNQGQGPNSSYNAVPPPNDKHMEHMDSGGRFSGGNSRFGNSGKMNHMHRNKNFPNQAGRKPGMEDRKRPMKDGKGYGDKKSFADRMRDRSPDRSQDGRSGDRSRGRTPDHVRSMSRSPMRDHKRSKSPLRPAKRRRVAARYAVVVPKHPVVSPELDGGEVKRKFTNMYVPSDFMMLKSSWINSFPIDKPFSLDFPCKFHIFPKEVDPLEEKAPPEPSDVDYIFSAKVILFSSPGLEDLLSSCNDEDYDDIPLTLSKAVSVLVGTRGREPLALGGPWSPSLDGSDPEADPTVLIRTAIRNVRALTGIDLSNCTQWYRFLEIYYYRGESVHKGKTVPARVETVVLFIPDVWSCLPTRDEWTSLHESYQAQMNRKINGEEEPEKIPKEEEEVEEIETKSTRQPTHHSLIDPKIIQMSDLKEELVARNLSPKGLKNQLIARLAKAIKTEAEDEEKKKKDDKKKEEDASKKKEEDTKEEAKKEEPPKYSDEKEKQNLARKYEMPESPHVIVHPDRTAKSGRFDCTMMTLSSLLSYRPEDNKEHSYELFLFAETFHGMLVRDFGTKILQALHEVPPKKEPAKQEKKKEVKDVKEKEKEAKKKENEEVEEVEDDAESSEKDKDSTKDKDEKKEEKVDEPVKKFIVDRELLFAFQYFDSTHCGYILEKDLEELLSSIGLLLSRAQIKKLIQKVVEKDAVFYKKLVEKPDPADPNAEEVPDFQANRELMPSFDGDEALEPSKKSNNEDNGFVSFKGKLIDIGKLLDQLSRNESSRNSTEKMYEELLHNHRHLKEQYEKTTDDVASVQDHLMKTQSSLNTANSEINSLRAKVSKYTNIVFQVKNCIEPVIRENTSSHSEKMKGGSKWDTKEIKKEPAEDSKADVKKKGVEEVMEVSDSEADTKATPAKDNKKKKEDKNDKAKLEKTAQETKETPKTTGAEAAKEEKVKKEEPATKQPATKAAEGKKTAKQGKQAAKQAESKQAAAKEAENEEADENQENLDSEDLDTSPSKEDKEPEAMEQEATPSAEEAKKVDHGSDAEDEAGTEDAAAKDEIEEEVVESPKKRRRVLPSPKKATPARRAVQRS